MVELYESKNYMKYFRKYESIMKFKGRLISLCMTYSQNDEKTILIKKYWEKKLRLKHKLVHVDKNLTEFR